MEDAERLKLTSEIVTAYLANANVSMADLPTLLLSVSDTLASLGQTIEPLPAGPSLTKAEIRKSIQPDKLISFEDGRSYTMLKRHLSKLGLTPNAYRQKWGLPSDYPMAAPAYSKRRSEVATTMGLGRQTPKRGVARGPEKANRAAKSR